MKATPSPPFKILPSPFLPTVRLSLYLSLLLLLLLLLFPSPTTPQGSPDFSSECNFFTETNTNTDDGGGGIQALFGDWYLSCLYDCLIPYNFGLLSGTSVECGRACPFPACPFGWVDDGRAEARCYPGVGSGIFVEMENGQAKGVPAFKGLFFIFSIFFFFFVFFFLDLVSSLSFSLSFFFFFFFLLSFFFFFFFFFLIFLFLSSPPFFLFFSFNINPFFVVGVLFSCLCDFLLPSIPKTYLYLKH